MARVQFAYPYTGADGKKYKQGQEADVDPGVAASLVNEGFAVRVAPKPGPKATDKKEG